MPEDFFFDSVSEPSVGFTPTIDADTQIDTSFRPSGGFLGTAVATTLGGIADVPDTVSSSLGFTERGQINQEMLNAIGFQGLKDFYANHKAAIEVGSGIASIIAADFTAGRLLRPAGVAMRATSKLPYVNRIATLDKQYNQAFRIAQASMLKSARTGAIGVEQYAGAITAGRLGQTALESTSAGVRNIFTRKAIQKGLARNLTTEGILAIGANENSFLFSEDLGENIMWMAGGLGIGAFADRMMAVHQMKKFANSDIVSRTFAKAYDPAGTETARLSASLYDADVDMDSLTQFGYLTGHFMDSATSYKLSADEGRNVELLPGGHRNPLTPRRNRLATQQDEEVRNLINKSTTHGIGGIQGSSFSMNTQKMPGYGNHIDYTLHRDPAAVYGVEELGRIPANSTSFDLGIERGNQIQTRLNKVTQALDDDGVWVTRDMKNPKTGLKEKTRVLRPLKDTEREAMMAERQFLEFRKGLVETHLIDGEFMPAEIGHIFDEWKEPEISITGDADYKVWGTKGAAGKNVGVSSELEIITPGSDETHQLSLDKIGFLDSIALYRSGQKALRWFVQNEKKMILPKNPNWFQLDMAEDYINKIQNEDLVVFPRGMTRDDARVQSFKQKVRAIRKDKSLMGGDTKKAYQARFKYNLPRLNSREAGLLGEEAHPIEILIRGMGIKDLENISYQDLVAGIRESRSITGLTEMSKDRMDTTVGNMFDFMLDDNGNPMERIVAFKRPTVPFEWTKDDLAERLAMRKMYFASKLSDPAAAPMSRDLTQGLLNDPDYVAASQVAGLQDQQLMSFLPGFSHASPQSVGGGVLNDVVSREWRDRDNPALLAGARLRDKLERRARAHMEKRITETMGDTHTRLNGPRNTGSKLLTDQFLTFRQGWDLKTKINKQTKRPEAQTITGQTPDGRAVKMFLLDEESLHNANRFKAAYGREIQEGDVLLSPKGTKVGVDDLGYEFLTKFQRLAEDINAEKNTLNAAMGLGKINTVPLYAPPPNIRGKYIGFTLDVNNKPVPNGTIVASTPEEFSRILNELEDVNNKFSPLNRPGHRFMRQEEITDFNTIWDDAQMNMVDPGTTAIQPGKRGKGTLIGMDLNPQAAEDALLWARDSYLKHGHDIMQNVMKDQIIALQTRAQIARESKRNAKSGLTEAKRRSIYDFQLENLLGRSAISSPGSLVGSVSRPVEDWINSALKGGKPAVNRVFRGAIDWAREHAPWKNDKASKEAFTKLTDSLGEYMPFKSVAELMERQHGAKRPPELAAITGNASRFEAAMRLRMFEVIHPLMNLSGIINAMPSVVRAMQPMKGEAREEFATRVGHLAKIFDIDPSRRIGVMDMPRLIYQTFKNTWNRERHADWDFMRSHGYVTQEVAEFHRQFAAVKTPGKWKALVVGDPNSKSAVAQKGLVGWVSVLSDRSEDFSRSWGHMLGLELADVVGIAGTEARHSFAHDIANKMIANYDPKNRPAIFQGALGAPIGLFQSFIWNYYQRLFRYVETGDMRSLATQYATQSALFGMTTVPGFNIVNKLFFDHDNGNDSPLDGIYQRFGESSADFLFGGVMSNLPKLMNILPGNQNVEGVDLYSRGDTNVRLPGFNAPPIFDTMSRVYGALSNGVYNWWHDNPNLTSNQVAETLSNMLTNRPIAGFIEQFFADGYDTDRFGQLVAESHGLMEQTARVIGIRSLRQSKELEAFYSNNNAKTLQRALMSDLNRSSRASIRAGDEAALPGFFNEYVQRGGDPRRFNQWMKRNAEAALETRGERQLDNMMKNPAKAELMQRLLDMGVSISESDETDENVLSNPYDATDFSTLPDSGPSVEPIDGLE